MKKRLSVDLPIVLHELLSRVCRKRHVTISRWVIRAILEKLIRDGDINKFDKW